MSDRVPVPADVKRSLRREAGFGCCRCGHPIFQYHHIISYSVEEHNRPKDMMCLCPNCHDMATAGILSQDEQRALKLHPCNIRRGQSNGQLSVRHWPLVMELGSVQVVNNGPFIIAEGVEILAVEQESAAALLSIRLFDEEGQPTLVVDQNEWRVGFDTWDMKFRYDNLTMWQSERRISLSLDMSGSTARVLGSFHVPGGGRIRITKQGLTLPDGQSSQDLGFAGLAFNIVDGHTFLLAEEEQARSVLVGSRRERIRGALAAYRENEARQSSGP